jgi:hypothetical protein
MSVVAYRINVPCEKMALVPFPYQRPVREDGSGTVSAQCPCDRHDLYLPSIPASLQTLGRCEYVAASAIAPHILRIISPLTFYLNLLRAIWTFDKKKPE